MSEKKSSPNLDSFGAAIKKLRHLKGISQEKVAEILGVSQAAISQFEKNERKPTQENINRIAALFGVSEADLQDPSDHLRAILKADIEGLSPDDLQIVHTFLEFIAFRRNSNYKRKSKE
jgi:transcriptional regulator with XRE-family HTH domain